MKIIILSMILAVFVSACSHKSESVAGNRKTEITSDASKPQYTIAATDLAGPAELATNSSPSGEHATIVVNFQLSSSKTEAFAKFTREHLNQQIQLVVGSKVVAEPYIGSEISGGAVAIAFSSFDEARAVKDILSQK